MIRKKPQYKRLGKGKKPPYKRLPKQSPVAVRCKRPLEVKYKKPVLKGTSLNLPNNHRMRLLIDKKKHKIVLLPHKFTDKEREAIQSHPQKHKLPLKDLKGILGSRVVEVPGALAEKSVSRERHSKLHEDIFKKIIKIKEAQMKPRIEQVERVKVLLKFLNKSLWQNRRTDVVNFIMKNYWKMGKTHAVEEFVERFSGTIDIEKFCNKAQEELKWVQQDLRHIRHVDPEHLPYKAGRSISGSCGTLSDFFRNIKIQLKEKNG